MKLSVRFSKPSNFWAVFLLFLGSFVVGFCAVYFTGIIPIANLIDEFQRATVNGLTVAWNLAVLLVGGTILLIISCIMFFVGIVGIFNYFLK